MFWFLSPFFWIFGLAGLAAAIAGAVLVHREYDPGWAISWLISVNAVTVVYFGLDKALAWTRLLRVPEKVLYGLVFGGGSPGGIIAMFLFRHKTRKASFQFTFWFTIALQVAAFCIWYFGYR